MTFFRYLTPLISSTVVVSLNLQNHLRKEILLRSSSTKELLVDVVLVDILETVKIGDTLQPKNDSGNGQSMALLQEERIVTGITTLDTVTTLAYDGPGITTNQTLVRPLTWVNKLMISQSMVTL